MHCRFRMFVHRCHRGCQALLPARLLQPGEASLPHGEVESQYVPVLGPSRASGGLFVLSAYDMSVFRRHSMKTRWLIGALAIVSVWAVLAPVPSRAELCTT